MATAMLDIETLGQGSNAFILQICIRLIDEPDTLTLNIDPWRVQAGSEIDNSTMQWWQKQPKHVRASVMDGTSSLTDALIALNAFIKKYNIERVWANSPSFDCIILTNAYKRLGIDNSFPKYWAWLDLRTVVTMAKELGADLPKLNNTHNAEQDVINQIDLLKRALAFINQKG